jgi:hypothetical protein
MDPQLRQEAIRKIELLFQSYLERFAYREWSAIGTFSCQSPEDNLAKDGGFILHREPDDTFDGR